MSEHRYSVYIVASRTGTLYIGMTGSLDRRVLQHKAGEIKGFASKYHCDRLVYYRVLMMFTGLSGARSN